MLLEFQIIKRGADALKSSLQPKSHGALRGVRGSVLEFLIAYLFELPSFFVCVLCTDCPCLVCLQVLLLGERCCRACGHHSTKKHCLEWDVIDSVFV